MALLKSLPATSLIFNNQEGCAGRGCCSFGLVYCLICNSFRSIAGGIHSGRKLPTLLNVAVRVPVQAARQDGEGQEKAGEKSEGRTGINFLNSKSALSSDRHSFNINIHQTLLDEEKSWHIMHYHLKKATTLTTCWIFC